MHPLSSIHQDFVLICSAVSLTFFWSLHLCSSLASRRLAAVAHCCARRRIRRLMKLRDSFPVPTWSRSTERSVRKAAWLGEGGYLTRLLWFLEDESSWLCWSIPFSLNATNHYKLCVCVCVQLRHCLFRPSKSKRHHYSQTLPQSAASVVPCHHSEEPEGNIKI